MTLFFESKFFHLNLEFFVSIYSYRVRVNEKKNLIQLNHTKKKCIIRNTRVINKFNDYMIFFSQLIQSKNLVIYDPLCLMRK